MARLLEHVFPCGLKWCSYSASKCIFTEPGALMGHGCSPSAARRFLKESKAPGGGWVSEARKVFIPRQAPEQKLVSVLVCVGSLSYCTSCVTSPHHPQHTWDVLSDTLKKRWLREIHSVLSETMPQHCWSWRWWHRVQPPPHITEEKQKETEVVSAFLQIFLLPCALCEQGYFRYINKCAVNWSAPNHSCTPPPQTAETQLRYREQVEGMWEESRLERTWKHLHTL